MVHLALNLPTLEPKGAGNGVGSFSLPGNQAQATGGRFSLNAGGLHTL